MTSSLPTSALTPEGEPELPDYGIAKLFDPEASAAGLDSDPTLTLSGATTPEYASPEQLRGATITTGSDVYSLGWCSTNCTLKPSACNGDYQRSCGLYHVEIGQVRAQIGEIAQAETEAQAAQDLLESAVRVDPDNAIPFQDLVRA